jgi:hypothetical protein
MLQCIHKCEYFITIVVVVVVVVVAAAAVVQIKGVGKS